MEHLEVAIVGAGAGGLGLAARLRQQGETSFAIFDRADRIGGTWRDNTYPGAASDVPSHLYSFSFAPNPHWSRRFPPQAEMLRYLERLTDDFGLRPTLRLGTVFTNARYDAASGRWRLELDGGREEVEASVLVAACGQLSVPTVPHFEGLDDFRGAHWHSARWNHEVPLGDARVGSIGSGASAIQIVPRLAESTGSLRVFQRTPPWIIPRKDRRYTLPERWAFAHLPAWRRLYRSYIYWRLESFYLGLGPSDAFQRMLENMAAKHLEKHVADPGLRARLTPDYRIGCKRILVDDDYYDALQKPGVELVTESIDRFVPEGIRTTDGRVHELDAVVFATGFDAQALVAPMRVEGPDGRTLDDIWAEGPEAHLGMTVAGLPNLFLVYGPNTNLGHNSILFMFECQFDYVLGCLEAMRARDARSIEVRPEAMTRFNAQLQAELGESVWAAGCSSWYMSKTGRVTNNWSGPATRYWWATRRPRPEQYVFA
jgi:cation diffusion facilitator CzcD-associated flavoprotein CzcO